MNYKLIRNCPFCQSRPISIKFPYKTKFNGIKFSYYKCEKCSTVYVDPIPDKITFKKMYAKDKYHDNHYAVLDMDSYRKSVQLLKKFVSKDALILDYGCGSGGFIKALKEQGLSPFGVEFDSSSVSFLKSNFEIEILSVDEFLSLDKKPLFDVIHLGDVLEHLPNPKEDIEMFLEYLKNDGLLFVEGPIEINPSIVYWSALMFGAIKRLIYPNSVANHPPTHLFRSDAKQQLKFFTQMDDNLEILHWHVYETGWPYSKGGALKKFIASISVRIGSLRLFDIVFGNRFKAIIRYKK